MRGCGDYCVRRIGKIVIAEDGWDHASVVECVAPRDSARVIANVSESAGVARDSSAADVIMRNA